MVCSTRVRQSKVKVHTANTTKSNHNMSCSKTCLLALSIHLTLRGKNAQALHRKSCRKCTLPCYSVTCFKHAIYLWPINALDRKQAHCWNTIIADTVGHRWRIRWLWASFGNVCFAYTFLFIPWNIERSYATGYWAGFIRLCRRQYSN